MKSIFLTLFTLLVVHAGLSQNLEERLIGKWLMQKVVQNDEDVTSEHNPKSNRYITFKRDASFESGGDPYGLNTGKFFVNNLNNTLFIDSKQGPDDDSMWTITINGNELIMRGVGSEWAEGFIMTSIRQE